MIKKIWDIVRTIFEHIGKIMSNIVNFILLSLTYFISIGIVSIIMKLSGKRFLDVKKQNKTSNWHEHKLTKQPLEKYYRTF